MDLEKDKFRPYIRMDDTNLFFAISKDACGYGEEIQNPRYLPRYVVFAFLLILKLCAVAETLTSTRVSVREYLFKQCEFQYV